MSEVVHAMVLLSHFHSLSSFVFSCGLTQQLDSLSSPKSTSPTQKTVLSNLPIDNNNVMDLKLTPNNNLDKNVSTVDGKNGLSSNGIFFFYLYAFLILQLLSIVSYM